MVSWRKAGLLLSLVFFAIPPVFALNSFTIKNIQIEGLQGLSPATVIRYMPVKVGQTLNATNTSTIISSLYQTGFFSNVSLSQSGNTLIVHVTERPTIASIKVTGNSAISSDQINSVLKELGLVQGQALDQAILDEVTKSLKSAYDMQGYYNASVSTAITKETRNRVIVNIHVSEGRVALVEKIHIIGNHVFSEKTLIKTLTLTTPTWNSFYTHANHYSKDAFNASLQALSDYYLNRGYLKFKIDSANAILTPDRKSIYLVIHLTEGAQYHLEGFNFTGNTIVPQTRLMQLPAVKSLKTGMVFSREKIMNAIKSIAGILGDEGYAFADVNVIPNSNDERKTVFISFHVTPGNRMYVRRINFAGNASTEDYVLRSAMRQSEGSQVSTSAIDASLRQLNLLGYFSDVKEKTVPVVGSQNQVDLNYTLSEQPSAQANFSVGYGTDGAVINAGVNEHNFLGTGKTVGVNFVNSVYQRSYSFNYNNPYYTPEGVQRGFNIYNTKTMPGELNIASYDYTNYGANIVYSVPFSLDDSYQFGVGVQRTDLSAGAGPSLQIQRFIQTQNDAFNQTVFTLGWTRNTLDRFYFPTQGLLQNFGAQVSAPLAGQALDYYKLSYQFHGYHPLPAGFIGSMVGSFGYGSGYGNTKGLPFFNNYYAGGLGTQGQVRGFETNSLGPRDSNNVAIGGNALLSATAQLIMPNPLSGDSFRTSVFLDAGNVYNTWNVYNTYPSDQVGVKLSSLRYSAGVDVQWRLPVLNAIIEFSVAKPLNQKIGDNTQIFAFNMGGSF